LKRKKGESGFQPDSETKKGGEKGKNLAKAPGAKRGETKKFKKRGKGSISGVLRAYQEEAIAEKIPH